MRTAARPSVPPVTSSARFPENPVLVQVWRGGAVESQHRGAWVVVDAAGSVVEGAGAFDAPIYTRSAVKCLQALPLIETGAAERFAYDDAELAVAISSHNAEAQHTERVLGVLGRLGLEVRHLQCGPQPPGDPAARAELKERGERFTSLHNNCSGKHAGFLALARHLGVPVERYLDPESAGQRLVRRALVDVSGVRDEDVTIAIDGCSAPTFRMPLVGLATAYARVANPSGLAPARRAACERMLGAVERFPELLAGKHERICTDLSRTTRGRLFPKIGAEAVYAIGVRGEGRGLAIKIDDGGARALHAVIVALLRRFRFASTEELAALEEWEERRLSNWAGLEVGRTEVLV